MELMTTTSPRNACRLFIVCGRNCHADKLQSLFATCGTIQSFHLALDRCQKSRGFAFCEYQDPACAAIAMKKFHQFALADGHVLKVTIAKENAVVKSKCKRQHLTDDSKKKSIRRTRVIKEDEAANGKRQRCAEKPMVLLIRKRKESIDKPSPVDQVVITVVHDMICVLEASNAHDVVAEYAKFSQKKEVHEMPVTSPPKQREKKKKKREEEQEKLCTDLLTSCIDSFSLNTSTKPAVERPLTADYRETRRRRVGSNDSDSSVEADHRMKTPSLSRKRSNMEPAAAKEPSRRLQKPSEAVISSSTQSTIAREASPSTSKKHCSKRRSSVSTTMPLTEPVQCPNDALTIAVPRSVRLFFASSYKFTQQELEAMFSVYGETIEQIQLVKSFGRLKTMAYLHYSTLTAARHVLETFQRENPSDQQGEIVRLSFADDSVATAVSSCPVPPGRWLLVVYDRSVSTETLTSMVQSYDGMELVDIKVAKSTGEPRGAAFVRFTTPQDAMVAAEQLQRACPLVRILQIEDPSHYSATHQALEVNPDAQETEDVDIGAVEARFAHMMRGNNADSPLLSAALRPQWNVPEAMLAPQRHWAPNGAPSYARPALDYPHQQMYHPPPPLPPFAPSPWSTAYPVSYAPPHVPVAFAASEHTYAIERQASYPHRPPSPSVRHRSNQHPQHQQQQQTAIAVSCATALPLSALVQILEATALHSMVLSITKEEDGSYLIELENAWHASDAAKQLDGTLWSPHAPLRVTTVAPHPRSSATGRRKRQRLDPRQHKR